MALFFYRAWAGIQNQREIYPADPIYYTRWGYAALLGVTLVAGLVLNSVYLLGYLVCPAAMLQVPHIAIVGLTIRDLLVCLFVLPAAIDWLVVGLASWNGGPGWCGTAVFFDFFLNTLYPLILMSLCLILYTRKLPPARPPSREVSLRIPGSRMSARSGYTQRTLASNIRAPDQQLQTRGSRAPSVASNRTAQGDFRRGFSKSASREPSVAGSEIGSAVGGRGRLQNSSFNDSFLSPNYRGPQPKSSVPLHLVEEETGYAGSVVGSELWESASLDYPGREDMDVDEFDADEDEPRLREWLRFLIPAAFLLSLGFGVPAATLIGTEKSPGCYVQVRPFDNPTSYINNDPGFNLMICSVVFTYIAPSLAMILLSLLLCTTRWTKDGKLNRFYKMCIALCVFFIAVKSPIDIIQFKELIFAIQGSRIINQLPNELEQEVLLIWAALLPVVANPIIYLTCVSDYRTNISNAWKLCLGKQTKEVYTDQNYMEEYEENKETKESDVL